MVQHIGLVREDERGRALAQFDPEGIPLEILELASPISACARFIDPYGNTIFNQLQLPVLIQEFAEMHERSADEGFRRRLGAVSKFLVESTEGHVYVRFIGD